MGIIQSKKKRAEKKEIKKKLKNAQKNNKTIDIIISSPISQRLDPIPEPRKKYVVDYSKEKIGTVKMNTDTGKKKPLRKVDYDINLERYKLYDKNSSIKSSSSDECASSSDESVSSSDESVPSNDL